MRKSGSRKAVAENKRRILARLSRGAASTDQLMRETGLNRSSVNKYMNHGLKGRAVCVGRGAGKSGRGYMWALDEQTKVKMPVRVREAIQEKEAGPGARREILDQVKAMTPDQVRLALLLLGRAAK